MKLYRGVRLALHTIAVHVEEEGKLSRLDPRFDVRNHSPDGFEWGYGGSGPAQLALALLCDVLGDYRVAERHYQEFKRAVITRLPDVGWEMTEESIWEWLREQSPRNDPEES